jgi:GDPmannose 4,6-dehydratase
LFNHESNLRPSHFVTRKIVETARRVAEGSSEKLELGNIAIVRDWGWAPEYVAAMWLMLQQDNPDDFVVATGKSVSLEVFVQKVFGSFGLDWPRHVIIRDKLFRPTDLSESWANPSKALEILGWEAKNKVDDVVRYLVAGLLC